MYNNIFKFATKELSQDAFLCWCINWINMEDKSSNMYKFGKDMLFRIIFNKSANSDCKDLKEAFNNDNITIKVIRQFNTIDKDNKQNRMDVVVTINNKYILIIEDKIDATVNMDSNDIDQLKRYKNAMEDFLKCGNDILKKGSNNKEKKDSNNKTIINKLELLGLSCKDCKNSKIISVLVKTGKVTEKEEELGHSIIYASDLLGVIEDYVNIVGKEYKIYLKDFSENLKEKVNINNTEKYIDIVNKGELLEGEKFAQKMTLYNCFYKYFGIIHRIGKVKNKFKDTTEIGGKKYEIYKNNKGVTQKGGSTFKKGSNVMIWTPKFVNYSDTWKNTYFESDGKIEEKYTGTANYEKLDNDAPKIRYTFKYDRDAFGNKYFTFIGLYVLDSDNEEIKSRVWKKVTHNTHPDLVLKDGAVTLNVEKINNSIKV